MYVLCDKRRQVKIINIAEGHTDKSQVTWEQSYQLMDKHELHLSTKFREGN